MEPVTLTSIATRAWEILDEESPEHHRLAEAAFEAVFVTINVGRETVTPSRPPSEAGPKLHLTTTPATLLAIVDGEQTLVEALESGQLDGLGSPAAISAAEQAMTVFVHGLARAPSGPSLLDALRQWKREHDSCPR